MSEALSFRAAIYRVGILRCVDVPERVGRQFAHWRNAPVRVSIGQASGCTRLVARGEGLYRVFLDTKVRRAAGVDTGDEVMVRLQLDPSIDSEPFPDDLLDVAEGIEGGLEALMVLPPGLKRQILKALGEAKSAPVRAKRLRRVAQILEERIE